jgi:hypothetical protein
MRGRELLASVLSLILIQGLFPTIISADSVQAIRANDEGIADLKYNVLQPLGARTISWSVLQLWVSRRTEMNSWPSHQSFSDGSKFADLNTRSQWYEQTNGELEASRLRIRAGLPAAATLGYAQLFDFQNSRFMDLQQSLEANSRVRAPDSLKQISAAARDVRVAATQALAGTLGQDGLKKAKEAGADLQALLDPSQLEPKVLEAARQKAQAILEQLSPDQRALFATMHDDREKYRQIAQQGFTRAKNLSEDLQKLLQPRDLGPEVLATAKAKTREILVALNPEAQKALKGLPEKLDTYRQIASIGAGLVATLPGRVPKGVVPLDEALRQAASFGQFERAQADLVNDFASQSRAVQASLSTDLDACQAAWPVLLQDALAAAAQAEPGKGIPEEIKRVASFTQQFSQLQDVLQGRIQGLGNPAAVAMLSFGIGQTHLASPMLVQNLAALATTKGNYASAALGLASSLGINPPPALQSALPLLTTAASFMTGAGALSAISGLAGGGGLLSFAGGFGGGGPDYSANFARIEAELAQINQRLTAIEQKLDGLEREIRADHEQVMSALEAIGFEVARTQSLLLSTLHSARLEPCKSAMMRPKSEDVTQDVKDCDTQLDRLLTGNDTPPIFTLEQNLTTKDLKDNARQALDRQKSARAILSKLKRGKDCGGLYYPSATVDDLWAKSHASSFSAVGCDALMTKPQLLEPGIVSTYVNVEQAAMLASYRSAKAIQFWSDRGDSIRRRWVRELALLDDASAQQTIMIGDLVLPEIVEAIESKTNLASIQQLWGVETPSILAENVARFWMWKKLGGGAAARATYGFAWNADDARFWYAATKTTPDEATFSSDIVNKVLPDGTSRNETVWFISFPGLLKVPLPAPKEWMHFELRWTNALTELVTTRRRLLDEISGMEYLDNLRRTGKTMDLLQIFALAEPEHKQKAMRPSR